MTRYRIYIDTAHVATVSRRAGIKAWMLEYQHRFCFAVGDNGEQINCRLTPIKNVLRCS